MSSSPTETTTLQIAMPQMGISVAEGTIVEWRKRPGDWVEADEPVCDVSTDKVDVEIPSPAAGRLGRILVGPGETVAVGSLSAYSQVSGSYLKLPGSRTCRGDGIQGGHGPPGQASDRPGDDSGTTTASVMTDGTSQLPSLSRLNDERRRRR